MERTKGLGGPAVAILAALCLPARAQETIPAPLPDEDESAVKLEEVVVTSTKREKSQRDIPGSVNAIRGEDLEKTHAQGMKDYLKLVPGVQFMDYGSADESVPIIRGIASQIGFGVTQVTTGVYLEDMPFADLFAPSSFPDMNPFDLERVEVLKGPQGTLFGSGALAGAIRYIVEKPHFALWQAKVSETVSSTNESAGLGTSSAVALNIPVGDTLAFRAVGIYRRDPGVYDMSADNCTPVLPSSTPHVIPATLNILSHQLGQLPGPVTLPFDISGTQVCNGKIRDEPDADWLHQYSGRLLAAWQPTERLKVSAFYFEQRSHQNDYGLADNANHLGSDNFPFASPRQHDFGGGNLLVTYDFDWAKLLSSTNRMTKHNATDIHAEWGFGLGSQNQIEYVTTTLDNVRGWTQEFRLSSPESSTGIFEWLIGASYMHYGNSPNMQFTYLGPDMPDPTSPDQVDTVRQDTAQVFATATQLATEKALFGEITARLNEYWEVTGGARRYQTGLKADTNLCGAQEAVFFMGQFCGPGHFTDKTNGLNPKLSVRYIHNKHVQWYALAAKGFQFGGIQINPPAPGFEQSANSAGFSFGPYKSSKLWNYESGLRTDWWNHRLHFDVTAFYLDWKDLQLSVAVPYLVTNLQLTVIANIGHAHSAGVEGAFEVLPFRGARWATSFTAASAVTDSPETINGVNVPAGTRLPGSPKFQIANVAAYEVPIFGWSVGPTLTHSYIGQSPDATPPTGTVGGYSTLDALLVIAKRDSRFQPELSFGVNNIADKRGVSYHQGLNNVVTGDPIEVFHYITPRTLVGSVSVRFQ